MTSEVYLSDISIALGEIDASVDEAASEGRLVSRAEDLAAAGFSRHRRAASATSALDLAVRAVAPVRQALTDVGAILYATALPDSANLGSMAAFEASRDVRHRMDFPASRLQAHFGLHDAAVIGVAQQACTGILGAVRLGRALLRSEHELQRVLCVTADRFPEGAHYEQAYNLISDGAAACLLSREPGGFRVLKSHHITNGAQALVSSEETAGAFFPYMHRLVAETMAKVDLDTTAIDWVVTQNTFDKALGVLASLLGIDSSRLYYPTLADAGHIIGSDCMANLACLEQDERLKPGDLVLLVMAGYGSNWQSLLLERV